MRQLSFMLSLLLLASVGCSPRGDSMKAPQGQGLENSQSSMSEKTADLLADTLSSPYWKKRAWLEKTARLLRGGQGLTSADDVDGMMKLSEEEIVRALMKDERFSDTILDFNSYFLGFKQDQIRILGNLNPNLLGLSTAMASAIEISRDGDYFRLFDFTGPMYVQPFSKIYRQGEDEKSPRSDKEIRQKHAQETREQIGALIDFAKQPGVTAVAICGKIMGAELLRPFYNDGYPFELIYRAVTFNPNWLAKLDFACLPPVSSTTEMLIAALTETRFRNDLFFKEIAKFEPADGYEIKSIADYRALDMAALGFGADWPAFDLQQAVTLRNSSTNMNRKRGAYVLKHFFCDDLTPLGFENPETHTGGAHGSDPACYACHYKLDPMAGFFRNYGLFFGDFSRSEKMFFDDLASTNREQYEKNWLAPERSGRRFNIGYVRSAGQTALNSYGETLSDLSRIVRAAPEAKMCLVKRLFEYFVARNQAVDAGYLQYLTELLTTEAAANSSRAVKNTIVRLLSSNAFHEYDMDPKKCYDFRPGDVRGESSVPCRVAYILNSNCVKCHDNAQDELHGNLDLSRWVDTGGGAMGFPHLDKNGRQRPARESLQIINDRLVSTDPNKRMPLKKIIANQDRQELYIWIQETFQTLGGAK